MSFSIHFLFFNQMLPRSPIALPRVIKLICVFWVCLYWHLTDNCFISAHGHLPTAAEVSISGGVSSYAITASTSTWIIHCTPTWNPRVEVTDYIDSSYGNCLASFLQVLHSQFYITAITDHTFCNSSTGDRNRSSICVLPFTVSSKEETSNLASLCALDFVVSHFSY